MKSTQKNKQLINLDAGEKDLLDSFESGEWTSVADLPKEKSKAQEAAQNSAPFGASRATALA